jgi:hypothetical protein
MLALSTSARDRPLVVEDQPIVGGQRFEVLREIRLIEYRPAMDNQQRLTLAGRCIIELRAINVQQTGFIGRR